jgi:hypothetical protein
MKDKFEELKIHVENLNELLKDPRFGLITWCEMYAEEMKWIADYWNYTIPTEVLKKIGNAVCIYKKDEKEGYYSYNQLDKFP